MNNSLNEIVENIAFSLGDQHNFTLRESLKHTVIAYREQLLREEDFNFTINDNYFSQKAILKLKDYEELGCNWRITENEIPIPIHFKTRGRSNYNFVGDKFKQKSFTQTTFEEYVFLRHLPYQSKTTYYVIVDGKMIILNNHRLCEIRLDGVFPDPRELVDICDNVEEVDDDAPFPMSGNMLTIIRKGILSGDYPIRQMGEEGVIKSDSTDENR